MTEIILPNSLEPGHKYVFRSGEYGTFYRYWYIDRAGNYWQYSNAPEGHKDYDIHGGNPMLSPEQLFPHQNPEFFTPEGYRRNKAPPEGVKVLPNEAYSPNSLSTIWKEYYLIPEGTGIGYIYLDKDCKENIDLYIQTQIRLVDAGLVNYRKYASEKFQSEHAKTKAVACILMLVDQGYFSVEELVEAKVEDIAFIDDTVLLLGRKFKCDAALLDYLSSLVIGRSLTEYLFIQMTMDGEIPFGYNTIYSTFAALKVSPVFLPYWHATHIFSKIVNKYSLFKIPIDDVESMAYLELSKVFNTTEDVRYLVDPQVSNTLMRSYKTSINKGITIEKSDDFGVAQIFSDLVDRRGDELQFSEFLHKQPLHSEYEGSTQVEETQLIEQANDSDKTLDDEQEDNSLDQEEVVLQTNSEDLQ